MTERFIYSYLSVTHRCLVGVRSGAYRLLDGQRPFRNAVLLQRGQVRGSTEAPTQCSATGGPGSHCPSPKIPRLDFCVSVRQSGCTAGGRYLLCAAPRTAEPPGATTALVTMANLTPVTALTPGCPDVSLFLPLVHPWCALSFTRSPEGMSLCGLRLYCMLLYIYLK